MEKELLTNVVALLVNKKANALEYGVMIRNLPDFDYVKFVEQINTDRTNEVFFLGFTPETIESLKDNLPVKENVLYKYTVEEAENSRNTGDESVFRILIVKRTEIEKLSSLRWFPEIDLEQVYTHSCKYTTKQLEGKTNAVIDSLIRALGRRAIRNILSFERVLEYLEQLLTAKATELPVVLRERYYRLGLCRDDSLDAGNPSVDDLVKKIQKNHSIVERIGNLEQAERQGITNYYADSNNSSVTPRAILQYYKTKDVELLKNMELSEVEKCLKAAKKRTTPATRTKDNYVTPTTLATQLIFDDNTDLIDSVIEQIEERLEDRDSPDKSERIQIDLDSAKVQIKTEPATEKIAEEMIGEEDYGGVVFANVSSPTEAIIELEQFEPFTDDFLSDVWDDLKKISSLLPDGEQISSALQVFISARKSISPYRMRLQDVPMLQVLSKKELFSKYLDSYEKLLVAINDDLPKIWGLAPLNAKKIVNKIMSLDNVFVLGEEECHAIPTPLNPLYLWKYTKLAEEILSNKGVSSMDECHLSEDDKSFIVRKADDIPDPLTVMLLPTTVSETGADYLPLAGRIGALPVYSTKQQINQSESGIETLKQAIIRYLCLYPHASMMLKIAIIDPPSVELVVSMLKMLNNDKEFNISGIDLSIFRTKEASINWVEIEDDSLNEGLLGKYRGKRSFNFQLRIANKTLPYASVLKEIEKEQHMLIMFDPNEVKIATAQNDRSVHIHPLCVPKVYQYNPVEEKVEIRPTNEGGVFSTYASILEKLNEHPSTFSHTSTFFNTPLKRETYDLMLEKADWLVILDQSLRNWDLSLRAASEKIFFRENDYRSVGIYSNNSKKFVLGYNTLIKQLGNYVPQDEGIGAVIQSIRELNNDGLLSIVSHTSNRIFDVNHGKGSLGLAIAAINYKKNYPDSILVGLDTQLAREWLSEREDGQLPDLIGIRIQTNNEAIIDIMEVKTYSDSVNSFEIVDESISGHAVEQVTVLEDLVKEIFGYSEKVTTVARKEILREQVFECLFENEMKPFDKHQHSQRLNDLFSGQDRTAVNKEIVFVDFDNTDSFVREYGGTGDYLGNKYTLIKIGSAEIQSIISGSEEKKAPIFEVEEHHEVGPVSSDKEDSRTDEYVEESKPIDTEKKGESSFTEKDFAIDSNKAGETHISEEPSEQQDDRIQVIEEKCARLNKVFRDYGIKAYPVESEHVLEAARFTRFKVKLKPGESYRSIERHKVDIGIQLEANGEILADHIRGTQFVSVDIPFAGDGKAIKLLDHLEILNESEGKLKIVAGQKPDSHFEVLDLARAPHLLVSGTTGSGKTIFLYSIIVSLLNQFGSDELELLIIDPKQTDFIFFEDLSHLYGDHVVISADEALEQIKQLNDVDKENRTRLLRESRSRDIESYNEKNPDDKMKRLVVIIDEYADLIQAAELQGIRREFEDLLLMLVQRVRNLGIHLVIATQRPTANIVTGNLKANIPYRVSFRLPSHQDSMTILDETGAENLLGKGDMIMKTDNETMRLQGLFITEDELSEFIEGIIKNEKQ